MIKLPKQWLRNEKIFKDRKELAKAGIHTPPVAGIWGSTDGASSIVLSGGYEDDIDDWNDILYTGQGGQDKPGGKQVADQEFTLGNEGLRISCKYNLPVRVTRGFQIKNGPPKGYRYDGLYYVKNYERVKGKSGFYVCRFNLSTEKSVEKFESELEYGKMELVWLREGELCKNTNVYSVLKRYSERQDRLKFRRKKYPLVRGAMWMEFTR